jgi:hypothetical protein
MSQSKETLPRDDAESQPESGYPAGQEPTKPSAAPGPKERQREAQAGSEAEFDSTPKPLSYRALTTRLDRDPE